MLQPLTNINLPRNSSIKAEKQKFDGFDFLRAVFSVAIVALHAELLSPLTLLGLESIKNVFDANIAYLAVPVFLQISLFLFYIKSEKAGSQYFIQKRLPKLVSLYLFWVISKTGFDLLFGFNEKSEAIKHGLSSVRGFIEFVVSGGVSPLYFFFSLIFLSAISEVLIVLFRALKIEQHKMAINYAFLCFSCIVISGFAIVGLIGDRESAIVNFLANLAQWNYNPLNFLPYVFTTAIVVQEFNQGRLAELTPKLKLKLGALLALFLLFTLVEWIAFKDLLNYSRLSLVFGSWLLLYLALLSTRSVPKIVKFISGCSLGIYTLHLFFTHGFFTRSTGFLSSLPFFTQFIGILIQFLVALGGSIALTLAFRRSKFLKGFV